MRAFLTIPLRLLTHNIRYATPDPAPGELPWLPARASRLVSELGFHLRFVPAGVVCLQEVLHSQLVDVMAGLEAQARMDGLRRKRRRKDGFERKQVSVQADVDGERETAGRRWEYVGVGRDDGRRAGEYAPILFQRSVWQLVEQQTLWLSETPHTPSKGWDAASPRILTVAVLRHRAAQQDLIVMNTHLDDQGEISRRRAAQLILATVDRLRARYDDAPLVLAGDLNSETDEAAYRIIAGAQSGLHDVRRLVASEEQRYGHNSTFTGFGHDRPQRIDFVFVSEARQWQVHGYAVAANRFDDGVYVSDHRAVVADLGIAVDVEDDETLVV